MAKNPIKVAITGGAGQISYSLLFRIANGDAFGKDQPIILQILEVEAVLPSLEGVLMELYDCAFPLLNDVIISSDTSKVFKNVDYAVLVGAKPRGPGMERKDLLLDNGKIFIEQGQALNDFANSNVKVLVVGNPCNTNCLIALSHAPNLSRKNFYAMTRLDQNRAKFLLAEKGSVPISQVKDVIIWGNHSSTLVPDFTHAKIGNEEVTKIIDKQWLEKEFTELVQKRGAAIIKARGKSSAASAANAIIDTLQFIHEDKFLDDWFSIAIDTDDNPYGISKDIIFSFPCIKQENLISIVNNLEWDDFIKYKIKVSESELLEEKEMVKGILGKNVR